MWFAENNGEIHPVEFFRRDNNGTNQCTGDRGLCEQTAVIHVALNKDANGDFICLLLCTEHINEAPFFIDSHLVGSDCDMPDARWYSERCSA